MTGVRTYMDRQRKRLQKASFKVFRPKGRQRLSNLDETPVVVFRSGPENCGVEKQMEDVE